MDEAKLRKLIEIFKESGVDELEYQESFWRGIRVRLGSNRPGSVTYHAPPASAPAAPRAAVGPEPAGGAALEDPAAVDADLHTIRAPMVGTFYVSPSPDTEAFVSAGDSVTVGRTLCIIEAMKIMNEIECDVSGDLVEVLVENGDPVEYNQPIMTVRIS